MTDDAQIHELNRQYRGLDKPTDVLSFAQQDASSDGAPSPPTIPGIGRLLGDVVISVETAARQAAARCASLDDELALLAVHGILHLLGYEDETEDGADRMRQRQEEILYCQSSARAG